jgi:hypothetical protein
MRKDIDRVTGALGAMKHVEEHEITWNDATIVNYSMCSSNLCCETGHTLSRNGVSIQVLRVIPAFPEMTTAFPSGREGLMVF